MSWPYERPATATVARTAAATATGTRFAAQPYYDAVFATPNLEGFWPCDDPVGGNEYPWDPGSFYDTLRQRAAIAGVVNPDGDLDWFLTGDSEDYTFGVDGFAGRKAILMDWPVSSPGSDIFPSLAGPAASFEAWVKVSSFPPTFSFIMASQDSGFLPTTGDCGMYLNGEEGGFSASSRLNPITVARRGAPFSLNAWHHLVATFDSVPTDSEGLKLYLDGEEPTYTLDLPEPSLSALSSSRMFAFAEAPPGGENLQDTTLQWLAAYSRALTPVEVLTHYLAGKADVA